MPRLLNYQTGLILLALILSPSLVVFSQAGMTSAPFLQIEPETRSGSMGNAFTALSDDNSAMFFNPAGLAFQHSNSISITHVNWLPSFDDDLFFDFIAYKHHIERIGTFGFHTTYLNYGSQRQTGENGEDLGSFKSYELSIGFSYGYQINQFHSFGFGLKYIKSQIIPQGLKVSGQSMSSGNSFSFDLGYLFRTKSSDSDLNFSGLGFSLTNFGQGLQYSDKAQVDPLPLMLRSGFLINTSLDTEGYNLLRLTFDVSKLMARIDIDGKSMSPFKALYSSWNDYNIRYDLNSSDVQTVTLSDQLMYSMGLEYIYNTIFALRSGFYTESKLNGDRSYLTFGSGFMYNIFSFDFGYLYSIKVDNPIANTIRLSLSVSL